MSVGVPGVLVALLQSKDVVVTGVAIAGNLDRIRVTLQSLNHKLFVQMT